MARRQAIHRARCAMHLGSDIGQERGKAPPQSAQDLLRQPRCADHQRRGRGHLSAEAAPAGVSDAARRRVLGDLPMPCVGRGYAPASDRYWTVQIRRVQAQVARNPDYWKPGRPYLDGIEYTIIRDPSTATLAFIVGKFDMTFPYELTVPQFDDVRSQVPQAIFELSPGAVNRHLLINRDTPPFNNPDLRRAMALSIDRKAFVDILSQGQGEIGGILQPPPGGLWGMPADQIAQLPGYDPDVVKNREQARQIMQKLGYGPDNRLKIKVTTREWSIYRDPAVLLIDQ